MLKRFFASRKNPYIPGFDTPEKIEIDLSGNTLELLLPPHHDYEGFEARQLPISNVNIYDASFYSDSEAGETFSHSSAFISRNWEYYGPIWRGRYIASTTFVAAIDRVNTFAEHMTCFNPNHLEQAIIHFLYKTAPFKPNKGLKKAPLNWKVVDQQYSKWFYFDVVNNCDNLQKEGEFIKAQYSSFAVTALDQHHYLKLMFHNNGYVPVSYAIKHMDALRDKVLGNIKLSLGPSSIRQFENAKQRWPSAKASEHRDPENWVYPEWRSGERSKNEPKIVILKPGFEVNIKPSMM